MRTTGLQPDGKKRVSMEPLEDSIVGNRPSPARDNGHLGALSRVAVDGCLDSTPRHQDALDQGAVLAMDAAVLELLYQGLVRLQRLGHDQ